MMNPCDKHEAQDVRESGAGFVCKVCEIDRLKDANRWAEMDIAELVDTLGVHPLFWNGVWQACLDETNVPVEHFKSEQDCRAWCDEKNKDVIDTPTMIIEKLRAQSTEGASRQKMIDRIYELANHNSLDCDKCALIADEVLVSGTQRPIPTPPDWLDPESDR